jgi:transposase
MGNPRGVARDFDALERRRLEAIRLLDQGLKQSEVAVRLKVARQTVSRWVKAARSGTGVLGLAKAGRAGRKPRLGEIERRRLRELLLRTPRELGYDLPAWTGAAVVGLIQREFGVTYHQGHISKLLSSL